MKSESIEIVVNGRVISTGVGSTVATALLNSGELAFRQSVSGEPRAPLCGMGVCYECRVTIDGVGHVRACMTQARAGMRVETARGSE